MPSGLSVGGGGPLGRVPWPSFWIWRTASWEGFGKPFTSGNGERSRFVSGAADAKVIRRPAVGIIEKRMLCGGWMNE